MLTDELERDLTNKNELISIVNGGLKSLPGKKVFLCGNSMILSEHLQDSASIRDTNGGYVFCNSSIQTTA